jgi:hypothetical protein
VVEILNNDKGPFQVLFGDDASADPNIVFPIVIAVFVIMVVIALRITLKDKGKSEMSEDELEKDRALLDDRLRQQAAFLGEEYKPERARAKEAEEIAEANRRIGGQQNKGN